MPTGQDGRTRPEGVAEGLYDRANPVLIGEGNCTAVKNVHFNRLSAEEAGGLRKLNHARPKMGGIRLRPAASRGSVLGMLRWRDGHLVAPATCQLAMPKFIEGHIRLDQDGFFPESGTATGTRLRQPLTGRFTEVLEATRPGGEHQFAPLVARGAREIERPSWGLGVGVVRPEGLQTTGLTDDSDADRVTPVFYWWDEPKKTLKVSAANVTIFPGRDYHIGVKLGAAVAAQWYVNGAPVGTLEGHGLFDLPTVAVMGTPQKQPVYLGRAYTREPSVDYAKIDRKHIYMGRFDATVTGTAAGTVTITGSQLGFAGAGVDSYVGYRVRATTGAQAGKLFVITLAAFVGPDQFTFTLPAGHGIGIGDKVDVVPAVEPLGVESAIQEVRLWKNIPEDAAIALLAKLQAVSNPNEQDPTYNALSGLAALSVPDLLAYWPLSDDGGNACREIAAGSTAFFAPSVLSQASGGGSASSRALLVDGETSSIQVEVSKDPNFFRNYAYNLGRQVGQDSHWNICLRIQFMIGSAAEGLNAGSIQDHVYETLASLGNPKAGAPVFEVRYSSFGAGFPGTLYFALPDGTFQTLGGVTLVPGVWYNALVGIEALATGSNNHRVYFQSVDASLNSFGAISAAFALGATSIDTTQTYRLAFGASIRGQDLKGVGRANHALLLVSALGYGFHPAHKAASINAQDLIEFIQTDEITAADETRPRVLGLTGGVSFATGSRNVTADVSAILPTYLRRFPIRCSQVELLFREKDKADRFLPDHVLVASASGRAALLIREHAQAPVSGSELRIQTWSGFSTLKTQDPAFETDLNAAREDGEDFWAFTENVFEDLAESLKGIGWAFDPAYEFVSPLRIAPHWGRGIVERFDIEIAGVRHFRKDSGDEALCAVAGGSLFEVDDRWRRGAPFSDRTASFQFRRYGDAQARQLEAIAQGPRLFSARSRVPPEEAIRLPVFVGLDPAETFATTAGYFFEAFVNLDGLDGKRTIASRAELSLAVVAGVRRWVWRKNWHWYLDQGLMVLEVKDESTGLSFSARILPGRSGIIRPNTWHCLAVQLDGVASQITVATFFIDGQSYASTLTGAPLNMGAVPALGGSTYLGAIGDEASAAFSDGLGGRMAGFRARNNFTVKDYTPTRVLLDPEDGLTFAMPMDDGQGQKLNATSGLGAFIGDEMVHVGSGLGDTTGREVAFDVFGDVLYLSTFLTRPWRYDLNYLTPVGIRAPAGRLKSATIVRRPLRVKATGGDVPSAIGNANRTNEVVGVGPHLTAFAGAQPSPSLQDIGCLVYAPTDPDQGAGVNDYPGDFIGVVVGFTATTYTINPTPYTEQAVAAAAVAWGLFRKAKAAVPAGAGSYLDAIQRLESSTAYGPKRLRPNGWNDNDIPTEEDLTTVVTDSACFHFRGNQFVEVPPFRADGLPVGPDRVLDLKGYLRLDELDTLGDDEQVIAEQAIDSGSGSWRLVIFDGGRLRFEFFDTTLGTFRTIRTVGKVLSPLQWYYVRLRYRFKAAGRCAYDATGGWEPDQRWSWKTAVAGQVQKDRNYRDGLWVFACEGLHTKDAGIVHANLGAGYMGDASEPVPCLLQTLPGSHAQVGSGAAPVARGGALTFNHSQSLPNLGLHRAAPFLSPERGDVLFPAVASALVDSGITLTILANTLQSIATGVLAPNFQLPAGFALPRSFSMNRDDAFDRNHSNILQGTHIAERSAPAAFKWFNQATAAAAAVTATPNLANAALTGDSYGSKQAWAVLVRVWSLVANGGGPGAPGDPVLPVGGSGDPARVLALVYLGNSDLGNAARGGVGGHTLYLTDDVIFGGDGGGALAVGAGVLAATATVHATIELPNGVNQSRVSTNRLVCPTLLEHGPNPVGIGDAPDTSEAPIRFGGTLTQGEENRPKSGVRGRMDHWGFSLLAVVPSATAIYTTDCLPPDAFFTGPADTRIASLPRLAFRHNLLIQDDVGNAWSGTSALRGTLVFRFDDVSGNIVQKDTAASAGGAPNGFMVKKGVTIQPEGIHRLRVTYFDPLQNRESNPSQEFLVALDGQDGAGDILEAESFFSILGLPISGDLRPGLERRVYKTLGGGATPLLYAEIPDNTTVGLTPRLSNELLAVSDVLRFDNGQAPFCRALVATESQMAYGGLDDAPNVIAFSKAFEPEHVPGVPIAFVESGRGGHITGLGYLKGFLVPAKRNGVFVTRPSGAGFETQRIQQSAGALSHNSFQDVDGTLFFAGPKGVETFWGNYAIYPASDVIEELYRRGLDLEHMSRSQGAAYQDRAQYLVSVQRLGDTEPRTILSSHMRFDQFGERYYVWSILEPGVPVFALASYEDRFERRQRVVLGALGFVYMIDDGLGVGVDAAGTSKAGSLVGVVGGFSGVGVISVQDLDPDLGGIDTLKGGLAGVPFLVVEELTEGGEPRRRFDGEDPILVSGEILRGISTGTSTATLYVRGPDDWSAFEGRRIIMGARDFLWRSKEFDAESDETTKGWQWLDLFMTPITGGAVFLKIFVNGDPTHYRAIRVPTDVSAFSVNLTNVNARTIQVQLEGYGLLGRFILHKLQLRSVPQQWARRQQQ
jgi:hypothetical protein